MNPKLTNNHSHRLTELSLATFVASVPEKTCPFRAAKQGGRGVESGVALC